jgi:hypothetical protein
MSTPTPLARTRPSTTVLWVVGAVIAAGLALTAVAVAAFALGADRAFMPLQPGP